MNGSTFTNVKKEWWGWRGAKHHSRLRLLFHLNVVTLVVFTLGDVESNRD
jgi:hypothetical protein